jgi:ABC-type Fe3+/spermidine/putrescine transport system ATPase subunit
VSALELRGVEVDRGAFKLGPVDLEVPEGTATVLLGPSGAGKTTLLRTIAGFLRPSRGSVDFGGAAVDGLPPERRGFGFVPPELGLFAHRRVFQNVRYPLALAGDPEADAKASRWVERFGLAPLADRFPSELSSGERQRVAMARALAAGPKLLLWDEPLAALDVESRDVLLTLLRELIESERIPLLLVTHDPASARSLASRFVVLERGRVRFDGAPERLSDGPLDRFTARFLGYENLYSRAELASAMDEALAPELLAGAGPDGVVVPSEAIAWSPGPPAVGAHAQVAALRWTAGGWRIALRHGPLTIHADAPRELPGVRIGDTVGVRLDPGAMKPLVAMLPERTP